MPRRSLTGCARLLSLVGFAFGLSPALASADPYGPAFQIPGTSGFNFATLDNQDARVDVATGANGDTTVLWQSGTPPAVTNYVQRIDALGRVLFNPTLQVGNSAIAIAAAGNGNFIVVSNVSDGSGSGVYATIYSRFGGIVVPQFRINDATAGDQKTHDVAMNSAGAFVVSWVSLVSGRDETSHVKAFRANGTAVAAEALVQTRGPAQSEMITGPNLAIDGFGGFAATWLQGNLELATYTDVWARRFSASGVAQGAAFAVNGYTPGQQGDARVAAAPGGTFAIAWSGPTPGASSESIFVQRYSAAGSPLGGEQIVSDGTRNADLGLDVAVAADGGFVVTWHDGSTTPEQVVARAYGSNGLALGPAFVVSAIDSSWTLSARIGMDAGGNFTISWLDHHFSNAAPRWLMARRYSPANTTFQILTNGQVLEPIAGAQNGWRYYRLSVPQGHATVEVFTSGGFGDADLYVRWGALPTLTAWDGRPYRAGNNEGVRMLNFPPGDWYIGLHGYNAYGGLRLQASSR